MIVFSLIKSIIEEVGGQDEDGRAEGESNDSIADPITIIKYDEVSLVRSGDCTAVL